MEIFHYGLITLTGFVSSFVGVNVGGGGLLTIPMLIFLGLPPQVALGSDRIAVMGVYTSVYNFHKHGKIDYHLGFHLMLVGVVFATLGTILILQVPDELLMRLLGFLMMAILLFFIFQKDLGVKAKKKISKARYALGLALFAPVGLWTGSISAGAGTIANYVVTGVFRKTFIESAATIKLFGLASHTIGCIIFVMNDKVDWPSALALLIGTTFGAMVGSNYGIKKGDAWMKRLFIVVVCLSSLKLIFG
jgi:uncharacterized membrane protein YfcA